MIARLRSLRLLALLLVAGTPGLGGVALQALHPCAAAMPWMAGSAATDPHAGHAGHGEAADEQRAPGDCQCIDSCSPAATASVPPVGLEVAALAAAEPARSVVASTVPVLPLPLDRFPPKTAPPLLGLA